MKKLFLFLCLFVAAVPAIAQNEWRDTVTNVEKAHLVRQKDQVVEGNQLVGGNIITKEYGTAKLWQAVWQAWQNGEFTPGGTFSAADSEAVYNIITKVDTSGFLRYSNLDRTTLTAKKSANEYSQRPITARIPEPYNIGQTVHPSVLHFDTPWNGYEYWMAITPYADSQNRFENPCVFGSHNGVNWEVPTGLTNPIEPTPTSGADLNADYNADPNLFYNNDTLYMAFRQSITQSGSVDLYVYMVKSTDGVNWSAKKQVLYFNIPDADPDNPYLSPSLVKDGSGNVYMYYTNYDHGTTTLSLARKPITGSPMVAANYGAEQSVSIIGKPDSRMPWHVEVQWNEEYGWEMLLNAATGKGGANGRLWLLSSSNGTSFDFDASLMNPFFENENQILYKSSFRRLDPNHYETWISAKGINNTWWTSYAIINRDGDFAKVSSEEDEKLITSKSVVAPSINSRNASHQHINTEFITSPTGLENAWGISAKTGDIRWERGSNTTLSAGDSLTVLEFNSLSGNVISGTINAFRGYVKIIIDGERVLYFNTNIYAQSGDGAGFQSFTVPPIKYDESIKIMVINPNAYSVKVGWSILNVFKRAYNTAGDMTGNNTVGPDIPPSSGGSSSGDAESLGGVPASSYALYSNVVRLTTDQTVAGIKNFTSNIGLGVASPLGQLHLKKSATGLTTPSTNFDNIIVEENSNVGISIISNGTGNAGISLGDAVNPSAGLIYYSNSLDAIFAYTGGVNRLSIWSNGKVGFGTNVTEPDELLEVNGNAKVDTLFGYVFGNNVIGALQPSYVDSSYQAVIDSLINYIDSALTNTETRYETQDRLLRESDAGGRFVSNSTVNHTITIPTGLTFNYGQVGIDFEAWNTGKLLLDCSNVTVWYRDDPDSRVQLSTQAEIWQGATLRPIAPDTYILIGSFSE